MDRSRRHRWQRIEAGPQADVHVIPIGDLRLHEETRVCWCGPDTLRDAEGTIIVAHNAADGRELVERYGVN